MLHMTRRAAVKAAGSDDGLADGEFEAIVSVFDNVDLYGDVVVAGAFTDTLAAWAAKGDPIPIYYSHQLRDPDMCIGEVLEAKETAEGLWVRGRLDIDDPGTSKAPQVYRLMKGRRLTQFSFTYDVDEGSWVEGKNDDGSSYQYYELRKLKLHEVGPTPIGANPSTELLAVKAASERAQLFAADVKAGRVLSAAHEDTLRSARTLLKSAIQNLDGVLSAAETSNDGKANVGEPATDEDPAAGKSQEPTRPTPALLSELLSLEFALAD